MRFYMYIDKDFLKNLVSVAGNIDFNIQFIEYSVEDNCINKDEMSLRPFVERVGDKGKEIRGRERKYKTKKNGDKNDKDDHNDDDKEKVTRDGFANKRGVGVSYETSKTTSFSREKKYINIEDISDMKNINFYHNLIENIRNNTRDSENKICEEYGYLDSLGYLRDENEFGDDCKIFKVNNTYIWYDKKKLVSDINFLSNISSKINVIGYTINENERSGNKIAKAIAIYIE